MEQQEVSPPKSSDTATPGQQLAIMAGVIALVVILVILPGNF